MLRITSAETDTGQRWMLHGQLAGPWAAELGSSWQKARGSFRGRTCVVDLSQVTFIDENGEQVLRAMRSDGVTFVASGVETRQLLADLGKKRSCLRKCISHMAYRKD